MLTESQSLALVKAKKLKIVSPQRKRKLRKRGIRVRWMQVLNAYVWEPGW